MGLVPKLVVSLVLLTLLPIAVMSALSLRHLSRIHEATVYQTQTILISSQLRLLSERLTQEQRRLSAFFSRIGGDAVALGGYAAELLRAGAGTAPAGPPHRPLDEHGAFTSAPEDADSVVFIPRYRPDAEAIVAASEPLEYMLKPILAREHRIVLGWFIHGASGVTRAYPWNDFAQMPRGRDLRTWPFYYLADGEHNSGGAEVYTGLYLDPLSRDWMISCVAPVRIGGSHEGTVGLDITVQNLLEEIDEVRLTERSVSMLLSPAGIIAASDNLPVATLGLDPDRPSHGQQLSDSTVPAVRELAQRIGTGDGTIEFVDTAAGRLFAGYASVQPPGWTLLLLVPEDEVLGPAAASIEKIVAETSGIRRNFLHILIFSVISVVVLAWIVFLHQSRGLRTILRGIRRVGEGDLDHRVEEGKGEFGHLGGALNSMAESLQNKKAELQRVYGEVEQSRKLAAVGRLAAGVAHEVNNPLATISTYTQLMLRDDGLSPDTRASLETITAEIQRIQEKLRNLLDLSRLQSIDRQPAAAGVLVRQVADLARHEAQAQAVEVRLELAAPDRLVLLDRAGFKQILWNLLGNAIEAQPGGGEVVVRTRFPATGNGGSRFVLEVEDRGPGIPEELLPKVFEPFFTTKEIGQGTGLGLAVCYRIVEGHAGHLEVENLAPRGCRFRVTLPGEDAP
jgi:signal transduction histidine kinase